MTFIESIHCTSHVHCEACRTTAEWRKGANAPDICPHGYTPDVLPIRNPTISTSTDHEKQGQVAECCDGGNEKRGSR